MIGIMIIVGLTLGLCAFDLLAWRCGADSTDAQAERRRVPTRRGAAREN